MDMTRLRIATWNLQWARPTSDRGQRCLAMLSEIDADIICLTEAFEDSFAGWKGHSFSSTADTGYPIRPGRRKVVVWAREPLVEPDPIGSVDFPTGRFLAATVARPVRLQVIGVCIPWKSAHVKSGRRDRRLWEDHQRYLAAMSQLDRFQNRELPTVVLGDFNQRISGKHVRRDVHEQLRTTFDSYRIPSSDLQDIDGKPAIDHIALRGPFHVLDSGVLSRFDEVGKQLSDHFGVWCDVECRID